MSDLSRLLATAWVRHSMCDRNEPNEHDLANAGAALRAVLPEVARRLREDVWPDGGDGERGAADAVLALLGGVA